MPENSLRNSRQVTGSSRGNSWQIHPNQHCISRWISQKSPTNFEQIFLEKPRNSRCIRKNSPGNSRRILSWIAIKIQRQTRKVTWKFHRYYSWSPTNPAGNLCRNFSKIQLESSPIHLDYSHEKSRQKPSWIFSTGKQEKANKISLKN